MSNNTGQTIIALLTGALVGAGIGILFAPDKGSVTRQKIKTGMEEAKDEMEHKFNELLSLLKKKGEDVKADLESSIENLVSSGSYKAEEAIEFLEKQLETLKAKNAKFHK
ncbi:MAG: YtxH domain-containing protein [Bacteroidota bacterium]